ncbi:winged helix-turn-helix domain-containing protein [Nocardia sp. CDC159]|uniref:Winged helix-turn-helix domain-containing protein n=1 Tax=Nocardia pulmonis TaxID=2951408 RepID=A0A9X2EA16_9NOCA|nr:MULTISPECIES: BTAD domain-containing putative transcriptional regulator [Nocardia]MCM6776524.1 winged helix-turn-helix domain-containing protein [Nocardia pulmonis]MCM6788948.1 winged helix-turn-helix domain-containing protein [Nocardia sp. CDC159]
MVRVQIGMLGPLEIRGDDGGSIEVPGARLRALLIALALEPGRAVSKATLVDWIWGERPPADAANALQALVSRLRRALPDGSIDVGSGGYRLAVAPDAVDAVRFERLLDQARGGDDATQSRLLREALELWRGAPLRDVGGQDSEAFDAVIARFEALRLAALEDRFEAEIRLGRGPELIGELSEVVARYPVRERLIAASMRALGAAGRGAEALIVYQNARETLADELGVDPSPELSALHVALLRGEVGARQEDRRTNLRAELTRYLGKQADIAAVRELLADHRLTTLTGPGGSGKTRLALETAHTLLDDLPDGAWLVELASLGPSGDVAQAALAALGLRDALLGGAPHAQPLDRLVAALRERETLLILDNCEHVIEAAAAFAHRVLGECRRLRILATSREPLGITGEALWRVEPLALPAEDADPGAIASAAAVALLRDRAGAVRKDLGSDAATLSTMARVCRALDGIPLAIELAAARLRTMSLDQLASRLDDRFRLLTGGSRTALPQHRTLRAVVDWSWELLSDAERMVLCRLAVFAGGASLEAAEQVCAGDGVERGEVLEVLTALTEKSLLVPVVGDSGPRYRLLDTIRQYARDRLAESGDADSARRAHLAYFTGLAETAEPRLRRAEQLEWLATLAVEHDNIAVAMRGALAAGDTGGAMRLAAAAGWYWWLSGHKSEGLELITAAADLPGAVDDDIRAMVYGLVVHYLTSGPSDEQRVREWIHEAYRLSGHSRVRYPLLGLVGALERMLRGPDAMPTAFEPLLTDPDPWVRALARLQMGKMRIVLGQPGREADAYLSQALAEFEELGERWGISFGLRELADRLATRGEFATACALFDRAIAVVVEVGAIDDAVRMRARQAQLYWLSGAAEASSAAMAEAQRYAEQSAWPHALAELAMARAELARWRGDAEQARHQIGIATTTLGSDAEQPHIRATIHSLLGYLTPGLAEARAHHTMAFRAAVEAGQPQVLAQILVGIADLALRGEHPERAARLLAASAAVRGLRDRSQPDEDRIERTARDSLGDERFAAATRLGARTNWQELAATALAG